MKTAALSLVFSALCLVSGTAQAGFFEDADAFFRRYVDEQGRVSYAALKRDPAPLEALVQRIARFSPKPGAEAKAFYLNAYNILTIYAIVERYPVKSPMDVEGFFDKIAFTIAGEKLTLNQIEDDKVRAVYKDARIHFALVCAAKSCPLLARFAYTPNRVEDQLEERAQFNLRDSKFLRVSGGKVEFTKIMEWYKADFLAEAESLVAYANRYRAKPLPSGASVSFYEYDWRLNDAP